jgi:hypothetical protein
MTRFSSKWILSHSTWYKFRRSRQMSLSKIVAKLREMNIKRSKSWVGNKRCDLLGMGAKTSAE